MIAAAPAANTLRLRPRLSGVLSALALAALAQLPSSPLRLEEPHRDSGVFLYAGWQILDGAIPYRDVWDHKPPAIFYIDALGLWLGGGSVWGVWLLETLSVCLALILGYRLLRNSLGHTAGIVGSGVWLGTFVLVGTSNVPEVFGLPVQFATFLLFVSAERTGSYGWRVCAIGALGALALLLKPNVLTGSIAVGVCFATLRVGQRQWAELTRVSMLTLLTGLGIVLAVCGYFAAHEALDDMLDAVLRYNLAYGAAPPVDQARVVLHGLALSSWSGAAPLAVAAWICLLRTPPGSMGLRRDRQALRALGLVALPACLVLSAGFGKAYAHYFLAWLPSLGLLSGLAIHRVQQRLTDDRGPGQRAQLGLRTAGLVCTGTLVLTSAAPVTVLLHRLLWADPSLEPRHEAVREIQHLTRPSDGVLIWGADSVVNFVTRRQAPTRFVYQYPLYLQGYQHTEAINELHLAIREHRPRVIVDTSGTNPLIPPLDRARRLSWRPGDPAYVPMKEMERLYQEIHENYVPIASIEQSRWTVYVNAGP